MLKNGRRRTLRWAALLACSAATVVLVAWPKEIGGSLCICTGIWDWKGDSFAACDKQAFDIRLEEYPAKAASRCTKPGLHSFSQNCLGIKDRIAFNSGIGTSYLDSCFGIPIGGRQCFGMPVTGTVSHEYIPLPCDYPYSDKTIIEMCKNQDSIKFDNVSVNCSTIRQTK